MACGYYYAERLPDVGRELATRHAHAHFRSGRGVPRMFDHRADFVPHDRVSPIENPHWTEFPQLHRDRLEPPLGRGEAAPHTTRERFVRLLQPVPDSREPEPDVHAA